MTADEIEAILAEAERCFASPGPGVPYGQAARVVAHMMVALRELTTLRPMETAPEDGEEILVTDGYDNDWLVFWGLGLYRDRPGWYVDIETLAPFKGIIKGWRPKPPVRKGEG